MSDERYPITWRGETYHVRQMTDDLKHKYCVWLYEFTLKRAQKVKNAKDYFAFERRLTVDLAEWTTDEYAHPDVLVSFNTREGCLKLFRLALSVEVDGKLKEVDDKILSDDDLNEMVKEKEGDPTSDFNLAMKRIRENADPKAKRGGHSLPAPVDANGPTLHSATSPSDSNGQKSAA